MTTMEKGGAYFVQEGGFWMLGICDDPTDYDGKKDGNDRCFASYICSDRFIKKNSRWCYHSKYRTYREATPTECEHLLKCLQDNVFRPIPSEPIVNDSYSII